MEYRYSCVIDAQGYYKTLVLIHLNKGKDGEKEEIQYYRLAEGEQLLDVPAPAGMVRPQWNGSSWVEKATEAEIEQWLNMRRNV